MNGRRGVIFDCMLFLQAAARDTGPAAECFRRVEAADFELYLSEAILIEIIDVLGRDWIRHRFPRLNPTFVREFVDRIRQKAIVIAPVPSAFRLPRDRDDEPYTDLAIAVGAEYLVTWNERHLTYLMRRDTPEGREFCRLCPHLKIMSPPSFLRDTLPTQNP